MSKRINGRSYQQVGTMVRERQEFHNNGKSLRGVFDYKGDYVVYSYGTEIARITKEGIAWLTTRKYSITTTGHQSRVSWGLDEAWTIHAPNLEHAKTTTKWRDLVAILGTDK